MNIKYTVTDPSGNITALVTSPAEKKDYTRIAAFLMERDSSIEQVGFVSPGHLEMAGGEFCGNATISAAALFARESGLACSKSDDISVCVSGADDPVIVRVTNLSDDGSFYAGKLSMPLPKSISTCSYTLSGGAASIQLPLVSFGGISHLIVSNQFMNDDEAESAIRDIAAELGAAAVGIMLVYDRINFESDNQELFIRPLVYVRDSGTLVWEHGCASGTAALGAYMAYLASVTHGKKNVTVRVTQPGGFMSVHASCDSFEISELSIVGQVRFVLSDECLCPGIV